MSQIQIILRDLKRGRRITPLQALTDYGCLRLAARIADLRAMGYKVKTDMIERDGKRYARYRL